MGWRSISAWYNIHSRAELICTFLSCLSVHSSSRCNSGKLAFCRSFHVFPAYPLYFLSRADRGILFGVVLWPSCWIRAAASGEALAQDLALT